MLQVTIDHVLIGVSFQNLPACCCGRCSTCVCVRARACACVCTHVRIYNTYILCNVHSATRHLSIHTPTSIYIHTSIYLIQIYVCTYIHLYINLMHMCIYPYQTTCCQRSRRCSCLISGTWPTMPKCSCCGAAATLQTSSITLQVAKFCLV
jgi:hypothetical protein